MGRFAEAEPLYKRALAIEEKALHPDHPNVGGTLRNLAGLYTTMNRHAEAEPLLKRALVIFEKEPGPDNLEIGDTLDRLAVLSIRP